MSSAQASVSIEIKNEVMEQEVEVKLSLYEMMAIRSVSTMVEIVGGQPLDRLKVNLQVPKAERVPVKELLGRGIGEFYAASTTSMIQRCFFYIPIIYMGVDYWNKNLKLSDPLYNGIAASCFTSALITPSVSIFENLKLEQQLGRTRGGINAALSMGQIFKNIYATNGLTGVFPSPFSTFAREAVFAAGICFISPAVHVYLKEEHDLDSVIAAGCIAGVSTQVLTQPFDTIKTWQENKKTGFLRSCRDIVNTEGVKFFLNGMVPRVARGMWTFTCLYYCTRTFTGLYEERKREQLPR